MVYSIVRRAISNEIRVRFSIHATPNSIMRHKKPIIKETSFRSAGYILEDTALWKKDLAYFISARNTNK